MKMWVKFSRYLVVVHAQARFFRGPRGQREQNRQQQSQGTREDAKNAPRANQHSGESPGNDNPFPMMRIFTQKMLRAQGLATDCQDFVSFLTLRLFRDIKILVISSEARNLLFPDADKQQVPPRIRSSE
jgi:hypothetical protein